MKLRLLIAVAAVVALWTLWPAQDQSLVSVPSASESIVVERDVAPRALAEASAQAGADEPGFGEVRTGIRTCDQLIARWASCDAVDKRAQSSLQQAFLQWKKHADGESEELKSGLATTCDRAGQAQDESLKAIGC